MRHNNACAKRFRFDMHDEDSRETSCEDGMHTRYSYKMPDLTCSGALTTIYVVKHKTANSKYAMLAYNPLVLIAFQNLNNSL